MDSFHSYYTRVNSCILLMEQLFFFLQLRSCLLQTNMKSAQKLWIVLAVDAFNVLSSYLGLLYLQLFIPTVVSAYLWQGIDSRGRTKRARKYLKCGLVVPLSLHVNNSLRLYRLPNHRQRRTEVTSYVVYNL